MHLGVNHRHEYRVLQIPLLFLTLFLIAVDQVVNQTIEALVFLAIALDQAFHLATFLL